MLPLGERAQYDCKTAPLRRKRLRGTSLQSQRSQSPKDSTAPALLLKLLRVSVGVGLVRFIARSAASLASEAFPRRQDPLRRHLRRTEYTGKVQLHLQLK